MELWDLQSETRQVTEFLKISEIAHVRRPAPVRGKKRKMVIKHYLKKMRKINFILTLSLMALIFCPCFGQTTTKSDFAFTDIYGNKFLIKNINNLPVLLDTTFLKTNLTGLYFYKADIDTTSCFDFIIADIKTIKKKKEFELKILIVRHKNDIESILKHQNFNHYRMTVKTIKDKLNIDSINWLFGEI